MTVALLAEKLGLTIVSAADQTQREVTGGYVCDMLSLAMSRAGAGDAWITIQTNVNVVAVASLADCACVIIPESIDVEMQTIERANEKQVIILKSDKTAFALAVLIGAML